MQPAGARTLREDDHGMSREAVLLQWERKIEVAEQHESGRFERDSDGDESAAERDELRDESAAEPVPLHPSEDATAPVPRRFERRSAPQAAPAAERRTVTIAGQPTPQRRRMTVVESQLAQPDRIALWAFLLGLFLVAVAAGTAHA
jgi:hypothetical protein